MQVHFVLYCTVVHSAMSTGSLPKKGWKIRSTWQCIIL